MGQSSPPKASDNRHRHWIALVCGCFFLWAIFSGRMWTSQKTAMPMIGARTITTHEMPLARASSVSPWKRDAWAFVGANAAPASASHDHARGVRPRTGEIVCVMWVGGLVEISGERGAADDDAWQLLRCR